MSTTPDSPSPEELVTLVAENPLLSTIDRSHLDGLEGQLHWVPLDTGQVLFDEGDPVDAFYFLIQGRLEVSTLQENLDGDSSNDRLVLAKLEPGSTIGEMQILTGGTRSATVSAKEPSGLVKFPKEAFDQFLAKDRRVVDELTKTIMPRLYRDQMVDVLPKLFGELDDAMLRDLDSKMTWRHLPRGHVLCFQGEPSDSFYIIISGRLQVLIKDAEGKSRQVGEMSQGESVGEMGVFTGEPRSATIIASRDSELVEFSKAEFDKFTQNYPQLIRHMTQLLIKRLQRVYRATKTARLSSNIMLAPASGGVSLDEFTSHLYASLQAMEKAADADSDPCLLLTSSSVDDRLGIHGISQTNEGKPDDLRLRSWLSEQEKKYRLILLQADPTISEWTKRCIRNADEVMYVANAAAKPQASEVVNEIHEQDTLNQTRRRRSLVLLHEPSVSRPTKTKAWLAELGLIHQSRRHAEGRHFHIRRGLSSNYDRVARFVSGREVGLVLSGGGARGFAHVGCIRAMRELGIPIDMIGGVSMGSLVGAAYAYSPHDFESTVDDIRSQLKGVMFDFTAPVLAIARGRRFDRRLMSWFDNARIEDLWTPYFCVSSNLTEAGIVVHETGPLWWSVRASGTLPGLISPMIHDGSLLFDGCLLDNLPMDVMRERLGTASVIAVDVVPPRDLKVDVTEVQSPSGWWLMWNKINPFVKRKVDLPNIVSIMQRAAELGSVYGRQKLIDSQLADIYLRPPVQDINIADFARVGDSARIGYEFCRDELAKWWAEHKAAKH